MQDAIINWEMENYISGSNRGTRLIFLSTLSNKSVKNVGKYLELSKVRMILEMPVFAEKVSMIRLRNSNNLLLFSSIYILIFKFSIIFWSLF